jgi:predicted ATPase/DNA-binding CsgD family transcriptional regulator
MTVAPRLSSAAQPPRPRSPLVGRAAELCAIGRLLQCDAVPLLTLTGPAGVGKTRLALQAAYDLGERAIFADGVAFVPLAGVRDPDLIAFVIAQALGVVEAVDRGPAEWLQAHLRARDVLLVLDNVEHVLDAAPLIGELLSACPSLQVLATSRSALRLSAERDFPVPPLALPDPDRLPSMADLAGTEAVALFLQRAEAVNPGFTLTEENAAAVAAICVELDGLPLAIELAAARTRLLAPHALLARLTNRLQLLTDGARDQPVRLRSMRQAIAWSYDLLTPEQQALFRRLALFAGGFTLEGAQGALGAGYPLGAAQDEASIPAPSAPSAPPAPPLLDGIASLVDQNLLTRTETADGEPRFGMLETIREFALSELRRCGEVEATCRHHAEHFLALAEEADRKLRGAEQASWLARLEAEHDNFRAALTCTTARGDSDLALRLAGALHWYWFLYRHWAEGRRWLEPAIGPAGASASPQTRARALAGAALLAFAQSDYGTVTSWLAESIALARTAKDEEGLARYLFYAAWPALIQGDFAAMDTFASESVARFRALGDRWGMAVALCSQGIAARRINPDTASARALFEESLALARDLGDEWSVARALNWLGELARAAGEFDRAVALYQESLARFRRIGQPGLVVVTLHNLGQAVAQQGDARRAAAHFAEGLALAAEHADPRFEAFCLAGLAATLGPLGHADQAARLFGAADALLAATGLSMDPLDRATGDRRREAASAQLGSSAYDAAYVAGRMLPLEDVLAEASRMAMILGGTETDRSARAPAVSPPHGLSPRELEVLRLLVEGHSDREIAATLAITYRTATSYVAAILNKLGVPSRTAAATYAVRHGLA